jgi:ribonuclease P protein component
MTAAPNSRQPAPPPTRHEPVPTDGVLAEPVTGARFPREARLLRPAEFKACFDARQSLSGRLFRLHLRAPAPAAARLGLAVSRKVSPHAVIRNRIKRIARDSFRRARSGLPPVDVVLLAKREAASASAAELRADLATLWRRLLTLKPLAREGTMRADSATIAPRTVDSPISPSATADPTARASRPDSE